MNLKSSRRKQLAQIFATHDHQHASRDAWLKAIQTDLMEWATPDRAEMRKKIADVMDKFGWKYPGATDEEQYGYQTQQRHRLIDALTDVMCGTDEPRWCEHWQFDPDQTYGNESMPWKRPCGTGWMMAGKSTKFCDLCGTPRPSQP